MEKTRTEARLVGDTKFDTGNPCRNGHLSPRTTTNGACIQCQKEHIERSRKRWREEYNRAKALK